MDSFFKDHSMDDLLSEIQMVYLADNRPWILGFSGGKDSTCMIQIIWKAMSQLPKKKRSKEIFIISSDTLVESPKIVETVMSTLQKMEKSAKENDLPIKTNLVRPKIDDTFWVCLLGKGYPAPSTTFRWCTDRLKIKSANKFIEERVSEYGEVIMALGSRKAESSTRAQVINAHHIEGSHLSHHSTLPQAFIYPPLQDFTTEDVWNYLLKNKLTPWGTNNRDLLSMYQDANAAECPLVVDTNTSSCGNSRFGCWVCTVVERDRSMENLIDSGELWMEPLLELRQMLKDTQDPEKKKEVRDLKHRNGNVVFWHDRLTMGPYKFEFCKKVLVSLLEAQNAVRKNGPDPNIDLITEEELHEIQRIWRIERGDWKNSVYEIYREITDKSISSNMDDMGTFGVIEQEELERACKDNGVPSLLIARALNAEFETQGASHRQKIHPKLEKLLSEEWGDMKKAVDVERKRKKQMEEVRI
ncbi:MAG: Phosphoadenosine phosphosulfate reductase [Cenarchaeum symbiont of Oopsacas minuta]|nr:Phosphoadenosine phosphosulfate reductase [Cenarchaeum symbiont of Oopsacas minuta]